MERVLQLLIELREEKKLSQRKLALALGVSATTVQDIESGARSLWIEDLARWLEVCDSSLAEFFSQLATADELARLAKDREFSEKLRAALILPRKRAALMGALKLLLPDEK